MSKGDKIMGKERIIIIVEVDERADYSSIQENMRDFMGVMRVSYPRLTSEIANSDYWDDEYFNKLLGED